MKSVCFSKKCVCFSKKQFFFLKIPIFFIKNKNKKYPRILRKNSNTTLKDPSLRCRSPNLVAKYDVFDANKDFRPNPGFWDSWHHSESYKRFAKGSVALPRFAKVFGTLPQTKNNSRNTPQGVVFTAQQRSLRWDCWIQRQSHATGYC